MSVQNIVNITEANLQQIARTVDGKTRAVLLLV